MTQTQKEQNIEEIALFLENRHFYLVDSQDLNAREVSQLRQACFERGIQYRVVKNTLLVKALQKINYPHLKSLEDKVLKGPTAIFSIAENASHPAKLLQDFHKVTKQKKPTLKAAFVYEDQLIGSNHLKALSQLKSKEELIAQVIQLLESPAHNLLSALQSASSNLTGSLKTLAGKDSSTV